MEKFSSCQEHILIPSLTSNPEMQALDPQMPYKNIYKKTLTNCLSIKKFLRFNIHYSKISGTNAVRNKWAASESETDVTSSSK